MNIEMTKKEKLFFNAYLQAIDFTECGEIDGPEAGSDLDEARCGDCHSYGERGTTCNNCKRGIYSEEIE